MGISNANSEDAACFEKGLAAYLKNDYGEAYSQFKAAIANCAQSQYMLCLLFQNGMVVDKNEEAAFEWCMKSAQQENVSAQFRLGVMYLKGEGVSQNEANALEWLQLASSNGSDEAVDVMQYIYTKDFGIGC